MSTTNASAVRQRQGDAAFSKLDKINSEVLTLTYGSFVAQLLRDTDNNAEEVSAHLDSMGRSVGLRLIEEFLAKSGIGNNPRNPCRDFGDVADVVAKVGFRMFLGISATVTNWSQDRREFSLVFEENPLSEFAELPAELANSAGKFHFSNVLCGVIRGALEMMQMKVEARFVRDTLTGSDTNEIRVVLKELLSEEKPEEDD